MNTAIVTTTRPDRKNRLPSWIRHNATRWSRMTPEGDGAHVFLSDHGNDHGKRAIISVHYGRRHIGNYDVNKLPRETQDDQFARARLLADELMIRTGLPALEVMSDRWSIDRDAEMIRSFPLLSALLIAGMMPNDVIRELLIAMVETQNVHDKWGVTLVNDVESKPASSHGVAS
jgi:hypothetical protein